MWMIIVYGIKIYFNLDCYKWKDMMILVIDYILNLIDVERKKIKNYFLCNRLKLFCFDGVNKLSDFVKMNIN